MTDVKKEFEGVIQYLDGWAWGVSASGETICLGKEDVVKIALANPKLKSGYSDIDQVVELERQLKKEYDEENGESRDKATASGKARKSIRGDNKRIRPLRALRGKRPNIRPTKAGRQITYNLPE